MKPPIEKPESEENPKLTILQELDAILRELKEKYEKEVAYIEYLKKRIEVSR